MTFWNILLDLILKSLGCYFFIATITAALHSWMTVLFWMGGRTSFLEPADSGCLEANTVHAATDPEQFLTALNYSRVGFEFDLDLSPT